MIRSLLVFCFLGLGSIASAHVAQPAIIQPVAALGWLNELIRWPLTLLLNTPEDPAEAFAAELPVPDFSPEPPCLLEPLTEITDPVALEFETVRGTSDVVRTDGLTQSASVALVRFESLVSRFGGTMTLTSAYRPPAYQQHLQDVWDKWMLELKASIEPACQQLRDEVYQEFASHGLLESQRPASISDHSRGTAFDAAVYLPVMKKKGRRAVTVDTLARRAGLYRPVRFQDPVHFRVGAPTKVSRAKARRASSRRV